MDGYGVWRTLLLGFVVSTILGASNAQADSKTKAQLEAAMKPYIQQAMNLAISKKGGVGGALPGWEGGADPKWYEGNWMGAFEMANDTWVNLFHDFPNGFLDCLGFHTHGICTNSWGFPTGIRVSYRWPLQQIHTRRFFQHRYIPPLYYQAYKASGYMENMFYPIVEELFAPNAIRHASLQAAVSLNSKSWLPFIPFEGPILPKFDVEPSDFPLDEPDERGRYDGGKIGNSGLDQIEYSLGPSLTHITWVVIANYFPILKLLPLVPPSQTPVPFNSEDPGFLEMTRDPLMGFVLYKDKNLRNDLKEWFLNPAACQEWMMNKNKKNIPFDLYDYTGGPLNPIAAALPSVLSPMPSGKLSKFNRMCTNNWGGSIPFTTVHQVHDTGFISAGKNFEKAIRMGVGLWHTFIKGTGAAKYVQYFHLDKKEDRYQLTYKDEWECKSVGTPAKPFAGANALATGGEHGLYSMTHWKRLGKKCMDFDEFFDFLDGMADLQGL